MCKRIVASALLVLCSSAALAQDRPGGGSLEHADRDNDGAVTRQEFDAARAEQFARLDRNSDGFLDDADAGERAAARDQAGERRAAMRARFDSNGDGKLSKEEFVAGPAPMFEQADADRSGVLDAKELEAAKAAAKQRMRRFRRH